MVPTKNKIHFLVVNDSDVMQKIIVALLKELGYLKISLSDSGEKALLSIRAASLIGAPIDFIISDSTMPMMTGLEFIREVRQLDGMNQIPILMVTAQAKTEDIISAVNAGADSYLVKPFKANSLRKKIEGLLVSHHLMDAPIVFGGLGQL